MSETMRIATGQFSEPTPDIMQFAAQMGVSGIVLNSPRLPGGERWEVEDLVRLRQRVEAYGLKIEAIENVPHHFYDLAMLGLEGADRQIANYQATVRHIGEAGIPILGYHWMPNGVWRTEPKVIRGGAVATAFDASTVSCDSPTHGRTFTADEMWDSYARFTDAVLPVAEASGVRLALHPDDPPVPSLGGVARLMRSFEGFKRAMEIGDSPNNGLDFLHGLLVGNGRGRAGGHAALRCREPPVLRALPRRAGHRSGLQRVLSWRGQRGHRRRHAHAVPRRLHGIPD